MICVCALSGENILGCTTCICTKNVRVCDTEMRTGVLEEHVGTRELRMCERTGTFFGCTLR